MRILLVSSLPPPAGGISSWTVRYCNYMEKNHIPVEVVNCAIIGTRAKQIYSKRSIGDEIHRTASVLKDLSRKIRRQKFDVAHLNTACARFGIYRDLLCELILRIHRIPVVLHCHCNIEDQVHGVMAKTAFRFMVKHATKVLALNRSSLEYVTSITPGKCETIPNFTEENQISSPKVYENQVKRVLFVGHVQARKGVVEVIQAAKKMPDKLFVLVGPVQDEAIRNDAGDNVVFMGNQSHESVMDEMRKADVFLFPSYTEGFANALVEAMAAGLPVITTPVGANEEMIENKGGIIVPVGDSEAIVVALEELESHPEMRIAMSKWNVDKVQKCYLIEPVIQRLLNLYREVCV